MEEKDLVEYEVLDTYSSSRCFLVELTEMWLGRVGGEVRGGSGRRSRRPSEFTLKIEIKNRVSTSGIVFVGFIQDGFVDMKFITFWVEESEKVNTFYSISFVKSFNLIQMRFHC